MSTYEDDRFDTYRDAAVQAQAEWEAQPERRCSWHAINFPGESDLIETGGNGQVSHGLCKACAEIVAREHWGDVELGEARGNAMADAIEAGDTDTADEIVAQAYVELLEADALEHARAAARDDYNNYLDWCDGENRAPGYLDQREFEEAI